MFGRKSPVAPQPPAVPFQHGDTCKTPAAEPAWSYTGDTRWERVCSCESQTWYEPERGKPAPVGDPDMHRHGADEVTGGPCTARALVRSSPDGGPYTTCPVCGTTVYLFDVSDLEPEQLAGLVR